MEEQSVRTHVHCICVWACGVSARTTPMHKYKPLNYAD